MSELETVLARAEALLLRIERLLPGDPGEPRWEDHAYAFRWRSQGYRGYLQSVRCLSSVRLEDLQCIDAQKQQVDRNTRQFMARLPANNVRSGRSAWQFAQDLAGRVGLERMAR
jgi:predicted AAA+ superfamily ATPase